MISYFGNMGTNCPTGHENNLAFQWGYIILFTEILHPEKHKHFDHDSLEYMLIFLLVNILSNTL